MTQREVSRRQRIIVTPDLVATWIRDNNAGQFNYMVKSVVLSVTIRSSRFTPICPSCWRPIYGVDGVVLTECCKEPIHQVCYFRRRLCPVCKVIPSLLLRFTGRGPVAGQVIARVEEMRDRKLCDLYTCPIHEECTVHLKFRKPVALHIPRHRLPVYMTRADRERFLTMIRTMETDAMLTSYSDFDSDSD